MRPAATGLSMPRPLRPGDRLALVSPAGPAPSAFVDRAEEMVRQWGLEPVLTPGAREQHPRWRYLAGRDDQRARDLTDAWCDPGIAGVLCLRGGYGTIRLLDRLDAARWRDAHPKRVFGSSDITCLHEFLSERVGVASWFTPMPATSVADDPIAMAGLRRALFEELSDWGPADGGAHVLSDEPVVTGEASGRLVGGNLSLLAMTRGALSGPVPDEIPRVALLEDVAEELYRIDGYLQALLRAGWFRSVVGVALGSWLACGTPEDGDVEQEIRALVAETLAPLGIPVAAGFPFGHGPAAVSLPLGASVRLRAAADGATLTLTGRPEAPGDRRGRP